MKCSAQNRLKDEPKPLYKALRFRVKDSTTGKHLVRLGNAVNTIWNFCNGAQIYALKHNKKWPDKIDLQLLTKGSSKLLGLSSQTVQMVCHEYVDKRVAHRKAKLRFRSSRGPKRSLGWIPFTNQDFEIVHNGLLLLRGQMFRFWQHQSLPDNVKIKSGCFAEDARGRWYLSIVVEVPRPAITSRSDVFAADPGHKTTLKGGFVREFAWGIGVSEYSLDQSRFYRDMESKLAEAQRRKRSRQVKTLHAKIANRRKDMQHKFTRKISNRAGAIFIGDISCNWQIKSGKAKATLDASWASLRNQSKHKGEHAGVLYADVAERFTTQDCSVCHARSGPKGAEGLAIRRWVCGACETVHDRDENSVLNIARLGCEALSLKWLRSPAL